MPLKKLLEQITKYEEFQAENAEKLERIEGRLGEIDLVRKENFNLVAHDNSNEEARHRLDKTEEEIADLKSQINAEKRRIRDKLRYKRTKLLRIQENVILALKEGLLERHDRLAELRNSLIPEAEERLSDLREEEKHAEEEISQLQKKQRKVNQIDLDTITGKSL